MWRSTFNRHKDAIEDMFGIFIECDRRDGFRYFIANSEVLAENSIQNWMLNTLSVNGVLSESRSVHDRILLESVPSSGEYLHKFIEAMKENSRISVSYRRYQADSITAMIVEPYCVKLFNRRWYALVKSLKSRSFFMLAFDRVHGIELTGEKFVLDDDFDASAWFSDCYGIVMDEKHPIETVKIRAYGLEVFYMRDLPLHHSQTEVNTTESYSDFVVKLRPTSDFLTPLLARGSQIRILEPQWIADEIRRMHQQAADLYRE